VHKLFLCLRYLRKRRIAFFGIAAVALCVALLIVATSLFSGFINSYLTHANRILGEIVLMPGVEIAEFDALAEHLEACPEIEHAQAVLQKGALLYLAKGDVRAVELVGIDLNQHSKDEYFRKGLLIQSEQENPDFSISPESLAVAREYLEKKYRRELKESELPVGAVLGIGIVADPDELTDEYDREAILTEIRNQTRPMVITTGKFSGGEEASAQKMTRTCWPVDVIQTGMHDADTRYVYLPLDFVKEIIGTKGEDGIYRCDGQDGQIQITSAKEFSAAQVQTKAVQAWEEFARKNLHYPEGKEPYALAIISTENPGVQMFTGEIRKQRLIIVSILGLIGLVAAILIFVILFMIVLQKRRDIGVLRSLGSSQQDVALVFLWFGAGIGVVGSGLGLALGIWATKNISLIEALLVKLFGFKIWKSGVYFFSEIPNTVDQQWAGIIVLGGIVMAILGALVPALRASRVQPVEALRYE
jgi:lipoprotein-releasing system permease protein